VAPIKSAGVMVVRSEDITTALTHRAINLPGTTRKGLRKVAPIRVRTRGADEGPGREPGSSPHPIPRSISPL
jgi:hypothetical protein